MSLPFRDRHDAGRQLAELLYRYAECNPIVLGIPRGGVPVAYEVAHAIRAPLDVFLMRHLFAPGSVDATVGIVASGGVRVLDEEQIRRLHIPPHALDEITQRERISLLARERTYRGQQHLRDLRDRIVILVDDGALPPASLAEAVAALREQQPAAVVLALPLAATDVRDRLARVADDVVTVAAPPPPIVTERWFLDLPPISHTEVRALLSLAQAEAQSRELAASGD
jgi:putative phosphoribosyl transferase